MSNIAIRVEGLSKQYSIGGKRGRYRTIRETLSTAASARFRKRRLPRHTDNTIWALKDASFEICRGEMVGIIGRNGAGKSTLLKILSRIAEPTTGFVSLYGTVGSLLEVGTGFHPELTGRENIFPNGAILGMRKAEIQARFDEIVAFAEVEKFIDTPVKHYSSGMYLRLAFAVAAHLEPEILVVDEVLAVGDVAFQSKCMGKMRDIAGHGRTILFVSHNLPAVQSLCGRGIVLRDGQVWKDAPAPEAVALYLSQLENKSQCEPIERRDRSGRGDIRLRAVNITGNSNTPNTLITGQFADFTFHLSSLRSHLDCMFTLYDQQGLPVASFSTTHHGPEDSVDHFLGNRIVCRLDPLLLRPGRYRINVALHTNGELQDHLEAAAVFAVNEGLVAGRAVSHGSPYGSVYLPHRWSLPA